MNAPKIAILGILRNVSFLRYYLRHTNTVSIFSNIKICHEHILYHIAEIGKDIQLLQKCRDSYDQNING